MRFFQKNALLFFEVWNTNRSENVKFRVPMHHFSDNIMIVKLPNTLNVSSLIEGFRKKVHIPKNRFNYIFSSIWFKKKNPQEALEKK